MDIFTLLLLGLATWRVSSLLVNEAGPFDMFVKIRELTGIEHIGSKPVVFPDKFLPQLLSCVWCASIWVGALWFAFWSLVPGTAIVCASVFAFSALSIIIESNVSGKS